jgi:hypothetical protein
MLYLQMYYETTNFTQEEAKVLIDDILSTMKKFEQSIRLELNTGKDYDILVFDEFQVDEEVLKNVFNSLYEFQL